MNFKLFTELKQEINATDAEIALHIFSPLLKYGLNADYDIIKQEYKNLILEHRELQKKIEPILNSIPQEKKDRILNDIDELRRRIKELETSKIDNYEGLILEIFK